MCEKRALLRGPMRDFAHCRAPAALLAQHSNSARPVWNRSCLKLKLVEARGLAVLYLPLRFYYIFKNSCGMRLRNHRE